MDNLKTVRISRKMLDIRPSIFYARTHYLDASAFLLSNLFDQSVLRIKRGFKARYLMFMERACKHIRKKSFYELNRQQFIALLRNQDILESSKNVEPHQFKQMIQIIESLHDVDFNVMMIMFSIGQFDKLYD